MVLLRILPPLLLRPYRASLSIIVATGSASVSESMVPEPSPTVEPNPCGTTENHDPIPKSPSAAKGDTGTDKRPWKDVVKGGNQLGMSLFFDEHSKHSTEIDVELDDFKSELEFWQFTLMGNFLGSKPTLKQVQEFAQKCWHHIASPVVQYYKKGWFSFRFTSLEDMNNVLNEGPWKLGNGSLILKQWYPNFSMEMDRVSTVPIWVLFPDLEPFLWSENVLSKMASKIGKPLFADLNTTCKAKLSFARIMVEADVSTTLPDHIVLNTPYDGQSSQRVIYEWLPFHCSGCGKLGHQLGSCKWHQPKVPAVSKKVYQPVSKPVPATVPSVSQQEEGQGSGCLELGGTSVGLDESTNPGGGKELEASTPTQLVVSSPLAAEKHSECHELGHCPPPPDDASVISSESQIAKKRDCIEAPVTPTSDDQFWVTPNKFDLLQSSDLPVPELVDKAPPDKPFLETRIKENKAKKIIKNRFTNYKVVCNYSKHYNGRIWLIWNPATVAVTTLLVHDQLIHCSIVHYATSHKFHLTLVYGNNDPQIRMALWSALASIKCTVTDWLVLGDFNVVWDVSERVSSSPPDLTDILDFNECLLNGSGCEFTWTNKQDDTTRVWSKLDRGLANPSGLSNFSTTHVTFLPAGVSDHSPVMVNVFDDPPVKSRFTFLNCWIGHSQYKGIVSQAWQTYVQGSAMFRVFSKLKYVKHGLLQLHKNHFSSLSERVSLARSSLMDCQHELQVSPLSQSLIDLERRLLAEYNSLKAAEMSMLKQKAKVDDIKHGDCSSKFFFAKIHERKKQQIIGRILDKDGKERTGLADVADGFVDYYTSLLGASTEVAPLDVEFIQQGPCVPDTDYAALTKPVTISEIKDALFEIGSIGVLALMGFLLLSLRILGIS
ncbi:uncharacterized protein LOC141601736 [Silene latifolia]|uniref:uncharacterized protein LOC141601736 n=1 Tax=Silene latifolia TaxID=37657 RepID=UPI003D78B318